MPRRPNPAFTLIELLVVITIIVVLLALLTPALDKAIYQAELTICGARIRGAAAGVASYAMASRRRYPHRDVLDGGTRESNMISVLFAAQGRISDDRPLLKGFVSLEQLKDPFCPPIDLSEEFNDFDSSVFANVGLWFGWQWRLGGAPETGMFRLGDRFSYTDPTAPGGPLVHRFSVLIGDFDSTSLANGTYGSHPDRDGVMHDVTWQSRTLGDEVTGVSTGVGPGTKFTLSRWISNDTFRRGPLDVNHAFSDLSVTRFDNVIVDHTDGSPDERMALGPKWNTTANGNGEWWIHLPR